MRSNSIFRNLLTVFAILVVLLAVVPSALAAGVSFNQSNQDMNQSGVLVAPAPDFQINIYGQPDTHKPSLGHGLAGDPITVIQQTGSNEGYTWDYVTFDNTSLKGWVRGDYVAPSSKTQNFKTQNSKAQTNVQTNHQFQSQSPQFNRKQTTHKQ